MQLQELKPLFMDAISGKREYALLCDVAIRLQQQQHRLMSSQLHHIPPVPRSYLQAAVYEVYELLYFCKYVHEGDEDQDDAASDSSGSSTQPLELLAHCYRILDAVSKGSELQIFLAWRLFDRLVQLGGVELEASQAAGLLLKMTQIARYGDKISENTSKQLTWANWHLAQDFLT